MPQSAPHPSNPSLDHIVLLVPYSHLTTPPSWLSQNFTLHSGGRHGDDKTENKLIALADGVYIELIAFVNDEESRMTGHWWNPNPEGMRAGDGDVVGSRGKGWGVIDFAFTFGGEDAIETFDILRPKPSSIPSIPTAWRPQPLIPGSRRTPTGTLISWKVAFPQAAARGCAPFWCLDVTPRERRVPGDAAAVEHACGAVGVKALEIVVEGGEDGEKGRALGALFEVYGMVEVSGEEGGKERGQGKSWRIGTPKAGDGSEEGGGCVVSVVPPRDEAERVAVGSGRNLVARLQLWTDDETMDGKEIKGEVNGNEVFISLSYRRV